MAGGGNAVGVERFFGFEEDFHHFFSMWRGVGKIMDFKAFSLSVICIIWTLSNLYPLVDRHSFTFYLPIRIRPYNMLLSILGTGIQTRPVIPTRIPVYTVYEYSARA